MENQKINIFDLFPEEKKVSSDEIDPILDTPLCYNGISEIDLMAM